MSREVEVQDHSAQYYTIRYSGYGRRYHEWLVDWLMREMPPDGGILDVGCGTGFVSECYWPKNYNITGIDLSPGMLHENYWPQQFLGDVCAMTFLDNYFDGVICRSLLHHLHNHRKGLSEMHRVLKPGGKVAFLETNKSVIATLVRRFTQHGDRFSQYHHSFKDTELLADISEWFTITDVQYLGFLCYPLFGFRDILDFSRIIPLKRFIYPLAQGVDTCLSQVPILNRLSWAIGIHAHKS